MSGYLFPILSGAALAFVFYAPKFAPILFVSFLPAYFFLARRVTGAPVRASARLGLLVGFLTAFAYSIVSAPSLWPSVEARRYIVTEFFGLSPAATPISFVLIQAASILLIAVWVSLPYAFWGGGTAVLISRNSPVAFGSAALWVVAEWLRRKIFFDLSWGDIGYAFVEYPMIGATSRFWGKYCIAFLVLLLGALCFEILTKSRRRRAAGAFAAAAILIFSLGGSAIRSTERTLRTGTELRIAALQGYLPWGQRVPERMDEPFSFPEPYRSQLQNLLASNTRFDIVLLPEEIVHDFPVPVVGRAFPEPMVVASTFWEGEVSVIREFLGASGASVFLMGQPLQRGRTFYNGMFAFTASGDIAVYGKRKLFPFIERLPAFLNLTPLSERIGQYTPGDGSPFLKLPGVNIFLVSCLEIESDALFHRFLGEEPSVIVAAGSEIGFSEAARRYQLTLARFRAMEQDKWLVRATKRGFSVLVDPLGRVVSVVPESDDDATIYGSVFSRPGKSPHSRRGDLPEVAAAILLAGWCIIQRRNAREDMR